MLKVFQSMAGIDTSQLMRVYSESNLKDGMIRYPDLSSHWQQIRTEEDFLSYLREDFFNRPMSLYAVWSLDGTYRAALRVEPYLDGLLLESVETAPEYRRQGYAYILISKMMEYLQKQGIRYVYSHVHKQNFPSLKLHEKIGFSVVSDTAKYIDGTVTQNSFTLVYKLDNWQ